MDRSLKERTIGAVVLVAFAVLVVPVFLDGPAEESATVTATVTLPGQNDQPREQKTIVLERDRTLPVPAAQASATDNSGSNSDITSGVDEPVAEPVAVAAKPDPAPVKPAPTEALESGASKAPSPIAKPSTADLAAKKPPATRPAIATPAPASTTGMWAVQLGSFSNRANAEKLAADLRNDGFAAFLSQLGTSNGELHRVRIGPQKDRNAAETVAAKLGKSGHKGQVVPHP